jgi:hypothetical protein
MPRSIRDFLMQNSSIGDFSRGRAGAGAAGILGSALGGPLLGYAARGIANKLYDRSDRRNHVADSPMPQTQDNNAALAMGMTDWGNPGPSNYSNQPSNAFQGSQAGASGDQENSFVINKDASGAVPDYLGNAPQPLMSPRNYGNGASQGGGIGFGWQSAQSPFDQGMLMDSLGFAGTTGTGPEDQAAMWLRKLVK